MTLDVASYLGALLGCFGIGWAFGRVQLLVKQFFEQV